MSATDGAIARRVASALGVDVVRWSRLGGGQVGRVVRCRLSDGREVVAKTSPGTPLDVEGFMLRFLGERSALPVPVVLHADADLLIEAFVEGSSERSEAVERDAGRLLAELHLVTAHAFGFERDTLLGPFPLDNRWTASWPEFYARRRLLPLAAMAVERGALPERERARVERIAAELPQRFDAEPAPALIHGDVWSGNVLARGGRVVAFLDPALYFADAEVELAFIDLFQTFGAAFHQAYRERRPVDPGYDRWRRDLYQLVPLLVHVALFGGSYLSALRERCDRLGA